MLSSKWNRWMLVGGAALGALAVGCGAEEDNGGGTQQPTPDSGTVSGLDAGLGSGSTSTCTPLGAQCTLGDGGTGLQACTNGVPSGACNPITSLFGDAGFGDSGFQFDAAGLIEAGIFEGGLSDGAVGGFPPCPSPLQCSALLASFVAGAGLPAGTSICASGGFFPPSCTMPADCATAGLTNSMCTMGFCIQPCMTQ